MLLAVAAAVASVSGCSLVRGLSGHRSVSVQLMTVTSPVFGEHQLIPRRYTCRGIGQSPPLYWSGAPPTARSFAVVVDDSLAPITPQVYWMVFDIGPATTELLVGQLPAGARQARNSLGQPGYVPVCPHGKPHLYRFTVYALNTMPALPSGTGLRQAWAEIAAHVVAAGRLTARAAP
jgi:Raf kinase inhibitor-like YbhB/YbcL family protein